MNRRINWIVESSGLSGGVRVIFEFCRGLKQCGWQPVVLSLNERPEWMQTRGVEWHKFDTYGDIKAYAEGLPDEFYVATWWRTAQVLNQIAVNHKYYLVQDDESWYYSSKLQKEIVRETYGYADFKMFTTSHWVETHVPNTHYVGIGMQQTFLPGTGKRVRQALAVGRRQAIKGYSYLAEVLSRCAAELALPIITFGQDQYIQWGIHGMHLVNPTDKKIRELYQSNMFFLSTSQHEGLCLPALEAMASGMCVIVTDSGGINDYCKSGENCVIVPNDDPRAMISVIGKLDKDHEKRESIMAAGIETAKQWTWNKPFGRLNEFFIST